MLTSAHADYFIAQFEALTALLALCVTSSILGYTGHDDLLAILPQNLSFGMLRGTPCSTTLTSDSTSECHQRAIVCCMCTYWWSSRLYPSAATGASHVHYEKLFSSFVAKLHQRFISYEEGTTFDWRQCLLHDPQHAYRLVSPE